jgi:hypothetical protein
MVGDTLANALRVITKRSIYSHRSRSDELSHYQESGTSAKFLLDAAT